MYSQNHLDSCREIFPTRSQEPTHYRPAWGRPTPGWSLSGSIPILSKPSWWEMRKCWGLHLQNTEDILGMEFILAPKFVWFPLLLKGCRKSPRKYDLFSSARSVRLATINISLHGQTRLPKDRQETDGQIWLFLFYNSGLLLVCY